MLRPTAALLKCTMCLPAEFGPFPLCVLTQWMTSQPHATSGALTGLLSVGGLSEGEREAVLRAVEEYNRNRDETGMGVCVCVWCCGQVALSCCVRWSRMGQNELPGQLVEEQLNAMGSCF